MNIITTNAFPDQATTAANDLEVLIAMHEALMQPYEAAFEIDDQDELADVQEPLYAKLLETRRALLAHRPLTLDEVRRKAEFMAKDRAFIWWDAEDLDIPDIIAALTPAAPDAEDFRDAA
ncbi:hypothetical protein EET67_23930 [Pseudaminobacter arsenicus]|uniref:Uncharacterized protein n=1 Tax=Borborobacter arsenicus TaxID=1851146 RepID=A0A432UZH6_9HYPH|nr:hypothetical protein [Pseudaminobacter arsenicus]RUM95329.1 hypothetical protein EET67_23930 [Pseudaminobacter arsenicus]